MTDIDNLFAVISRFGNKRVVVAGDMIADVFIHGEIARVSREAPVLILAHRATEIVPGGAANTVANLHALGAEALPVGFLGADEAGDALLGHFRRLGVDTSGIRQAGGYTTPTKTRILAGAVHAAEQQVLRIDRAGGPAASRRGPSLGAALGKALRRADAVLISDYGYGAATPELVRRAADRPLPVTLDSRYGLTSFAGLTAATPNEPEIEAAVGFRIDDDAERLEAAGRQILRAQKHRALLVTRGRNGMALFEPRRKTVHLPIVGSDEAADVTGAGDTVIATFTLSLAAGASFLDAARLANHAGGLAVMKHGTRPVGVDELRASVELGDTRR